MTRFESLIGFFGAESRAEFVRSLLVHCQKVSLPASQDLPIDVRERIR